MYSTRCALVGWMTSLNSSLNTSAKAWNTHRPTYIGPWRTCIQPSSLRSQTTYKATARLTGTAIARIFSTRSAEHTSELQSLLGISYSVFCLKKQIDIVRQQDTNAYTTQHHK